MNALPCLAVACLALAEPDVLNLGDLRESQIGTLPAAARPDLKPPDNEPIDYQVVRTVDEQTLLLRPVTWKRLQTGGHVPSPGAVFGLTGVRHGGRYADGEWLRHPGQQVFEVGGTFQFKGRHYRAIRPVPR